MALLPGVLIANRYEVIRSLGRGGVGEVFEARHLQTGLIVALKLLHPYVRQDEAIYKRFQREARAAGMLSSPYVARMFDLVEDSIHGPAIIFELLLGETLQDRLKRLPRLDLSSVDVLVRESLQGLQAAHAAGIIHRDLKPANIFLEKYLGAPFRVKLLDFGISKLAELIVTPLTKPQQSLGSLAFMPPEQFEHAAEVDGRADLYALGTVVFRALTNELPYSSATLSEMLTRKRNEAARTLFLASGVPFDPQLETWIACMLERNPTHRFASATDALIAWRQLPIWGEESSSGPSSRPPPSGSRGSGAPVPSVP